MTVMVTGAAGFVGLNLVERLLQHGRAVLGFSRSLPDAALMSRFARLPGVLGWIQGDVRDPDSLRTAMAAHGVRSVAHMATITSNAEREMRAAGDVIEVNLVGLANVIAAAAETGARRFVNVGSIAVFGPDTEDGGLLLEDTPHDPRTLYAITKSAGDALVARLGALHDLDWVTARLGRVFGPYEHNSGVRDTMSQIHQVTECARQGRAVQFERPCMKNWNYARDTAADLQILLEADRLPHRTYNLGAPYAWSLADWCARLAERTPGFTYAVGPAEDGAQPIDLWGAKDGALLAWARFEQDFRRPPPHTLDSAFGDYMAFLDQAPMVGQA